MSGSAPRSPRSSRSSRARRKSSGCSSAARSPGWTSASLTCGFIGSLCGRRAAPFASGRPVPASCRICQTVEAAIGWPRLTRSPRTLPVPPTLGSRSRCGSRVCGSRLPWEAAPDAVGWCLDWTERASAVGVGTRWPLVARPCEGSGDPTSCWIAWSRGWFNAAVHLSGGSSSVYARRVESPRLAWRACDRSEDQP